MAKETQETAQLPRKPIRVALLKFDSRYPQEVPGGTLPGSALKEETQENKQLVTIELHPWARAFMVCIQKPGQEPRRGYIPEGRVVYWEAAEQ